MPAEPSSNGASTPARTAARRPGKKAADKVPRVPVQVKLKPALAQWLHVQALGRRTTISAIVEELLERQPTEFYLQRRSAASAVEAPPALGVVSDAECA